MLTLTAGILLLALAGYQFFRNGQADSDRPAADAAPLADKRPGATPMSREIADGSPSQAATPAAVAGNPEAPCAN